MGFPESRWDMSMDDHISPVPGADVKQIVIPRSQAEPGNEETKADGKWGCRDESLNPRLIAGIPPG